MSILEINNLSFSYDGGTTPVFEHVSFRLDTDWRLGFTGRNGRGKTTFLKLLLGEYEYSGTIRCAVPFVYYPFSVTDESAWVCVRKICGAFARNCPLWAYRRKQHTDLTAHCQAANRPRCRRRFCFPGKIVFTFWMNRPTTWTVPRAKPWENIWRTKKDSF